MEIFKTLCTSVFVKTLIKYKMVNKITKPSNKNKQERIARRKLEKKIPNMILGIVVTTPVKGMEGALEWLKDIRIHKYWAFFSHLTYAEMISIDEDNLKFFLNNYGATETIREGARNKIIKSIIELRERSDKLKQINPVKFKESCTTISSILKTPLSVMDLEKDGTDLTELLKLKIKIVVEMSIKLKEGVEFIKPLLEEYAKHPSTTENEKKSSEAWLDSIKTNTFYRRKYSYALTGRKPEDAIIQKPEVKIKKEIFTPNIYDDEKITLKPEVKIKKEILSPMKDKVKIDWIKQEVEPENENIKKEYTLVIERIQNSEKTLKNQTTSYSEFTENYEIILNPMYALKNEMIPHPEFTRSYEMVINSKYTLDNEINLKRNNELQLRKMYNQLDKVAYELNEASSMAFSFLKTPSSFFKNEEDSHTIVKNKLTQVTKMARGFLQDSNFSQPEPTNFSIYIEKHVLSPYVASPPLSTYRPGI